MIICKETTNRTLKASWWYDHRIIIKICYIEFTLKADHHEEKPVDLTAVENKKPENIWQEP